MTLRLAAFLAGAAFLLAAPAGAAILHEAAHRSGLAAAHAKGHERHAILSSGVDAGVQTNAPSPVAAHAPPAAPPAPSARVRASRAAAARPSSASSVRLAPSRAPPR